MCSINHIFVFIHNVIREVFVLLNKKYFSNKAITPQQQSYMYMYHPSADNGIGHVLVFTGSGTDTLVLPATHCVSDKPCPTWSGLTICIGTNMRSDRMTACCLWFHWMLPRQPKTKNILLKHGSAWHCLKVKLYL